MPIPLRALCAAVVITVVPAIAHAQPWPAQQPIRIVVPYPAGGNADAAARALSEPLTAELHQRIIVDNRPGASSAIGTDIVARAAPDGYTIGVVSDSHAINHVLSGLPKAGDIIGAKVSYDAVKDFIPVAGMIEVPLVLVVNPKVPARDLKSLIEFSTKERKDGMNFGTMGPGSPWSIRLHQLEALTGASFVDVPYKGLAPAANDLLAGQTDTMLMPVHYAQQYVNAGKLVPIVTLGAKRHPLMPNVPTLAESGYPSPPISNYLFFVAPKGTPPEVVDTLNRAFKTALSDPEVAQTLRSQGIVEAQDQTPQGLATFISAEVPKWRDLIKSAHVSID